MTDTSVLLRDLYADIFELVNEGCRADGDRDAELTRELWRAVHANRTAPAAVLLMANLLSSAALLIAERQEQALRELRQNGGPS